MLDIKIGDKVKITEFYEAQYSKEWINNHREAEVVSLNHKLIPFSKLEKEDRILYRTLYGVKESYDLYDLGIKFDGDNAIYKVSQLGFMKVPNE